MTLVEAYQCELCAQHFACPFDVDGVSGVNVAQQAFIPPEDSSWHLCKRCIDAIYVAEKKRVVASNRIEIPGAKGEENESE